MPKQGNIDFNLNVKKGDTSGLDSLRKQLNELKIIASDIDFSLDDFEIRQVMSTISAIESAMNKAFDPNLNSVNINKFNQILKNSGYDLAGIQKGLSLMGVEGDKAFLKLTGNLMNFNKAVKQTNAFLDNIAKSFFNTVKYTAFNAILNSISGTINKAFYYVKDLDRSLNDIRIVTGKNADEMERFAESANEAAKKLAVTTKDYTQGSLIYYQQGLDDETVKTLTDITAMTSNVTGQSMSAVSEELTAVWNGYQVANQAAKEGMQVYQEYVDKMAAVGAATASDLQELATAMSKVASAASAMGVGFDDLNAQIATIVSVTRQAPESVGTALKTIYARLGDLKVDGVDEFGTKLGEVSEQLQIMGINIIDVNGDVRDMTSVMTEVAQKWNTWTDAQKQAAAVAMAGKRQYNNLVALFDNWDMYGEALETSMEAAGTLERQQEIALDSLANKMDQLSATAEDLYDSLLNEDDLKTLVTGLTNLVQLMADFADATGGINNLLLTLGATASRVFNKQIAHGLSTVINNFTNEKNQKIIDAQRQSEIQQQYSNSKIYQPRDNSATEAVRIQGLQEINSQYNKLVQYQSIMNDEERTQANLIMDMTVKAQELNLEVQHQAENWSTNVNSAGMLNKNLLKDLDDLENINNELAKIKNISGQLTLMSEIKTTKPNFFKDEKNNRQVKIDAENYFKKYSDDYQFKNMYKLDSTQIDAMAKRFGELVIQTKDTNKAFAQLGKELDTISGKTSAIITLKNEAGETAERVKALSNSFASEMDLTSTISHITQTIGAVGQLTFGFNTLINTIDILNNSDLSFGEKVSQVFMNWMFALPMIKTGLEKLNETFKMSNVISTIFSTKKAQEIALSKLENTQKQVLKSLLDAEAKKRNVTIAELDKQIVAEKTDIVTKQAETIATDQAASATWRLTEAIAANPIGAAIIAITALITITTVLVKLREKQIEQQIEESKKIIETNKAKEEEVKANQNLVKSYKELLAQQAKGEKVSESLYQKAIEVARAYDIQGASILATAGNYEELTRRIKEAQLEESQKNAKIAKESAIEASKNVIKQASGGIKKGLVGDNEVTYSNTLTKQTAKAMKNIGISFSDIDPDKVSSNIISGSWKVDFTNPKAVKEFADQIDYMVDYTAKSGDEAGNTFFKKLQKGMAESLPELENQLSLFYEETTNIAFGNIDLESIDNINELAKKIQEVKDKLAADIPTDEIDKYVNKYLSGIDSIQVSLDKIDIANALAQKEKKKDPSADVNKLFDKYLEQINKFNDSELAYLSVHLNTDLLTENLEDWMEEHQPIISLLGEKGASTSFKSALSSFNEKTGFDNATVDSLFAEGSNTAKWLPSKEEFQQQDIATQYDLITQAMIRSTQAAVEHKDKTVEALKEERNLLEAVYQAQDKAAARDAKENITNLTEGNEELKDSYDDIYQLAIKLANSTEKLSGEEQELLDTVEATGQADKAQLTLWGERIQKAEDTKASIEALNGEIENAINLENDYKTDLQNLNTTLKLHSKVMDDIQTAYSNLTNMVDDYKETGHWTIDNVQKLIEMDDKYIATLEMENGTLQLNDETFQKLALAKIDDMRVTILSTAYKKLSALASTEEGEAAIAAANAIIESAIATDQLSENARNALPNLELLKRKLAEIGNYYNTDSDRYKAGQNIIKAVENELAALNDAAGEIGKGGSAMKKVLHTGKDSKSSSSKDKDKELKKLEEEFDRYWEIHKALDQIDRDMKKLDKDQQNLHGYELIRSLKQENELLANQAQLYEQMAAAQAQEAEELRGKLSNSGVIFDASGAVINYAQATAAALEAYNKAVQQYNAGLLDDAAFEIHEKAFEEFKKNLERYDKLFYTEMQETQDKLDDIRRQTLANNLKAWEVEIQVKLDFKDLERQWNDFLTEVSEDFMKVFKDIKVEMRSMLTDAQSYIGGEGTINTILEAIRTVTGEIDKMMGGGTSDMFESVSQAQEKLKELNSQLLEAGKSLHDLWVKAWQAYLDGIDQAAEKFDNLMDRFDRINNELEFQGKLIKLLYGDEAYGLMSKLYEGQEKNTKAQMESLKKQADMWKKMFDDSGATMDNQSNWTEDQKKYYEEWMEAQDKLNDKVLDYIQLLQDDYLNTVKATLKELETAITGSSLKDIQEEWEDISAEADKYYDSVEGAYHIQTLANKIDQSIASTNNLQAQQKLMKLREREITYLREKKDLTEFDIKASEAKYQIALKEIALQEAQQNKTSMKLTRNEQGNWSYQYVADETDVMTKQQELLNAYNNLYQLASDAYEENLEKLQELQEKYLEKAREIAENENLTEEQKQIKLTELREIYLKKYEQLAGENALYRDTLAESSAGLLLTLYEQDQENYEHMTEAERDLVDKLIDANVDDYMELEDAVRNNYNEIGTTAKEVMTETRRDWTSGAQQLADLWNKDNGASVKAQVTNAYNKIQKANEEYQKKVDECAAIVERDFSEEGIAGAIEKAEEETDNLKDKTQELVDESEPYLRRLKEYVDEIGDAWKSVQDEIKDAISLIEEYLRKIGEVASASAAAANIGGESGGGSPGGGSGEGPSTPSTPSQEQKKEVYGHQTGRYLGKMTLSEARARWGDGEHGYVEDFGGRYIYVETMKSGGYTGQWNNDSGKLAMLHQKELVLNADDTKNFLSGIDMMRSMVASNGSIEQAVLKAATNMAYSLGNFSIGSVPSATNNNSTTDNVFNITAEFPNANSVDEIREAILTLPNIASQYANMNKR